MYNSLSGLGMSLRQLHLWLAQTGLEKKDKQEGKWRLFSPVELFALSTLKALKDETDLSISKHPELITFLRDHEECALKAIENWSGGQQPSLITNLKNTSKINELKGFAPGFTGVDGDNQFKNSILIVTMQLDLQIQTVFDAIKIGGSDRQRMTIEQLIESRATNISRKKMEQSQSASNTTAPKHKIRLPLSAAF